MIEKVAKSGSKSPAPTTARSRRIAPFGPPPLIQGEDRGAYNKLLARVSAAVKPVDILEEFWVHDVVDLEWEVLRLRRLKAALMTNSASKALRTVLDRLLDEETDDTDDDEMGYPDDEMGDPSEETGDPGEETGDPDEETDGTEWDPSRLAKEWVRKSPDAIKEVDRILASNDLTMDAVRAEMLSENIDHVERIDRMIAMAEARRNAALREVDRHRATFGQELRSTVREIEDGEFKVIEARPAKGRGPA
jgi:hypothetical protein